MQSDNLSKDYLKRIFEQKELFDFTINKKKQNKSLFEKENNDFTENLKIHKISLEEHKLKVF